jgi:hypothetical protein
MPKGILNGGNQAHYRTNGRFAIRKRVQPPVVRDESPRARRTRRVRRIC